MEAAAPTLLDASHLASLAEWLRKHNIRATTHHCLLVQQLFVRLGAQGQLPEKPEKLPSLLAPIFCADPEQQQRFPEVFADWWKAEFETEIFSPPPIQKKIASDGKLDAVESWRRWRIMAILASTIALSAWIAWQSLHERQLTGHVNGTNGIAISGVTISSKGNNPSLSGTNGDFELSLRAHEFPLDVVFSKPGYYGATSHVSVFWVFGATSSRLEITLTNTSAFPNNEYPETPLTNKHTQTVERAAGVAQDTVRLERVIQPWPSYRLNLAGLLACLPILLALAAYAWLRWWRRRVEPVLERMQSETPENLRKVHLAGGLHGLLPGLGLRELARDLRRRRVFPSRELDVAASMAATLRRGGFVTPVFGSRRESEYLLLIDRAGLQDHQAALVTLLADTLKEANVSIERWYFDREPARLCSSRETTTGAAIEFLGLEELAARTPQHRVFIFSEGSVFFDPYTGEPRPWVEHLKRWQETVLFTLETHDRWGAYEAVLERLGVMPLPLTRDGIGTLSALFGGYFTGADFGGGHKTSPVPLSRMPRRWLEREALTAAATERLCADLTGHLGSRGFRWLAACAAYPQIHWGITLRLGTLIMPDVREQEIVLPRLARLIWMREAFMPDWLRVALLSRLDADTATQVRKSLQTMLGHALLKPGSEIPLEIAVEGAQSRKTFRRLWQTGGRLLRGFQTGQIFRRAVRESESEAPLRDYVFLKFLSGRRLEALSLDASSELARGRHLSKIWMWSLRPWVLWSTAVVATLVAVVYLGLVRDGIESVAFSPDGTRLASGSWDKTVKLWDVATGKVLRTFTGHTDCVADVTFSPDGTRLASGSLDGTVKLWDLATGKEMNTLTGHRHQVTSVAFSPDGTRLASGSWDKTVKLWDVAMGTVVNTLVGHSDLVYSVAFSPDGTRIASGSFDSTIRLWDGITGKGLNTLNWYSNWIYGVTFSPDGTQLASGSGDNTIKLWDLAAGKEVNTLIGHTDWVLDVTFSPDGTRIASGSRDKTVKLWDVATGNAVFTLTGHSNNVDSVAFSPDGNRLASGSSDDTVRIYSMTRATGLKVMLVGCDDAGGPQALPTPVADVRAVAKLLNARYGAATTALINPNRSTLEKELDLFRRQITTNDTVIVMISGSGEIRNDDGLSTFAFRLSYGVNDTNAWRGMEISHYLRDLPARHAMLIADVEGAWAYLGPETVVEDDLNVQGKRVRTELASSLINQVPLARTQHSVFARALLEVLSGQTGRLGGQVLTREVAKLMLANGTAGTVQQPSYAPMIEAKHEAGEFYLPAPVHLGISVDIQEPLTAPLTPVRRAETTQSVLGVKDDGSTADPVPPQTTQQPASQITRPPTIRILYQGSANAAFAAQLRRDLASVTFDGMVPTVTEPENIFQRGKSVTWVTLNNPLEVRYFKRDAALRERAERIYNLAIEFANKAGRSLEGDIISSTLTADSTINLSADLSNYFEIVLAATRQTFGPQPSMVLELEHRPEPVLVDGTITYTIRVTNDGEAELTNLAVAFTSEQGITLVGSREYSIQANAAFFPILRSLPPQMSTFFTVEARGATAGKALQTVTVSCPQLARQEAKTDTTTVTAKPPGTPLGVLLEMVDEPDPIQPGERTLYSIRVTNQGFVDLTNLATVFEADDFTTPVRSRGGSIEGKKVIFSMVPVLRPKQSVTYTVEVEGTREGDSRPKATVTCSELTKPIVEEESTAVTSVNSKLDRRAPGLLLEVVDDPDPIRVGERTSYTIKVTNQGNMDATNLATVFEADDFTTPVSSAQGTIEGKKVIFNKVPVLKPKQSVAFTVRLQGTKEGDSRQKVTVTCSELTKPIVEDESTHVY